MSVDHMSTFIIITTHHNVLIVHPGLPVHTGTCISYHNSTYDRISSSYSIDVHIIPVYYFPTIDVGSILFVDVHERKNIDTT